ncbi:MAG: DNA-binding protein [Dictyoglomus sp. NZ13-RE01]|nr:MAG: DNA-binding protein [Dictyoglomus sp. NZ13-RE01]
MWDLFEEEFYLPKEVAEKLRVSLRTVQRWLEEEKIKGIKVGGVWRIPESSLKEFLRQQ